MIDWILDLIRDYFLSYLTPLWNSIAFWRSLGLISFAGLILGMKYKDEILSYLNSEDSKAHDKKVFKNLNEIINEDELNEIIDNASDSHGITLEQVSALSEYLEALQKIENRFLINRIRKAAQEHFQSVNRLKRFTAGNFFTKETDPPDKITGYWLYPNLTPELSEKYKNKANELVSICFEAKENYDQYRQIIKDELKC